MLQSLLRQVIGQVYSSQTMYTDSQIQDWILDRHGGTRDITFMPSDRDRVMALLCHLLKTYNLVSVSDNDGNDRQSEIATPTLFDGHSGFLHIILDCDRSLIHRLQIFVDWVGRECCVEISFFPADLNLARFTVEDFQALVEEWNSFLQAEDYFVRFENASWELYDATGLGVIYTRSSMAAVGRST
jgi:hypothetical protein